MQKGQSRDPLEADGCQKQMEDEMSRKHPTLRLSPLKAALLPFAENFFAIQQHVVYSRSFRGNWGAAFNIRQKFSPEEEEKEEPKAGTKAINNSL